jgi:hypothetical protein
MRSAGARPGAAAASLGSHPEPPADASIPACWRRRLHQPVGSPARSSAG